MLIMSNSLSSLDHDHNHDFDVYDDANVLCFMLIFADHDIRQSSAFLYVHHHHYFHDH